MICLNPLQTEAESLAENWFWSFSEYSRLATRTSLLNLYFASLYMTLSPLLKANSFCDLNCRVMGHGGTVRSTVASQQEGCGFKSRIVQHVGACSRAFLCGVCMFSPCSPGFPPLNPNNKNMQKEQMLVGPDPDPDQVRTEHLDLVPGRRIAGRPLLLAVPGGGRQDGKTQRTSSTVVPPACVCVLCVCHRSYVCNAVWL